MKNWTREGHVLNYHGKNALYIERIVDKNNNAELSPTMCDAIAEFIRKTLDKTDLEKLHREWMKR